MIKSRERFYDKKEELVSELSNLQFVVTNLTNACSKWIRGSGKFEVVHQTYLDSVRINAKISLLVKIYFEHLLTAQTNLINSPFSKLAGQF
ncbi:hypothetical protein HYN46_08160 [Aquirhabdus parva]|uniref:Uncharacterized protein n=2 Tax=Aquirhabdus parva TaxID=2283318 RepID=A0A345P6A1_9GAMM|nr:hypothetical protein HYN46_08160 [Aquirhabdus parva]